MATKLRRSLYIGLGGTGINAILKTKKMFIENYGDVPPMIGFLGIDTDKRQYTKPIKTDNNKNVTLTPQEQYSISVSSPIEYYKVRKMQGYLDWLPDGNSQYIRSLDKGAGQIRTNGRLAFEYHVSELTDRITRAIQSISSDKAEGNDQYQLLDTEIPEIHLVFSVCGGTGCGTFIDVAYLIRTIIPVNITGYAVLPNVFLNMLSGPSVARVKPNAYGALLDLDYFMHMNDTSNDVELPWRPAGAKSINSKPFDAVYLIDNTNERNVTFQHVDNLTSMISLALISASGDIGSNIQSIADNTRNSIIDNPCQIGDKKAWVSVLGNSEIVFKRNKVAEAYQKKISQFIINKLTTYSGNDIASVGKNEADNWIDSRDVNIREDDKDSLIDALSRSKPNAPEIAKYSDARNEINAYLQVALPTDTVMSKRVSDKIAEVIKQLRIKVDEVLNSEKGNGNVWVALKMLECIKSQVTSFKGLMVKEQAMYETHTSRLEQSLKTSISDLLELEDRIILFGRSSKFRSASEDVTNAADRFTENKWEIIRRVYATQFFNALLEAIDKHIARVENINMLFLALYKQYEDGINDINNQFAGRQSTVEVDLTKPFVQNIQIDAENVNVNGFIKVIGKLYSIEDDVDIMSAFDQYCQALPDVNRWYNYSIEDVLSQFCKGDDFEELNKIIDNSINKAAPMASINIGGNAKTTKGGNVNGQVINTNYFVIVPDADNTILRKNNCFQARCHESPTFISSGLNDRVIIYREKGVMPLCLIGSVAAGEHDYSLSPVTYHFDVHIYNEICLKRHQIMPRYGSDSDEGSILKMWVLGFIFGLIKYDKSSKSYWIIDEKHGSSLNKYWIDTKEPYRDRAYLIFSNQYSTLEEQYNTKIAEKIKDMGDAQLKELIVEIKADDNYYDIYSQVSVQKSRLGNREYVETAKLMEKEVDFINKKLGVE